MGGLAAGGSGRHFWAGVFFAGVTPPGVVILRRSYSAPVILWAALGCLIGRAVQVYPFSWIVNRCSSSRRLNFPEQHIVWFAGLRGAVAFTCALRFPEAAGHNNRDLFLCTTMVLIGASLIFFGWPTSKVLELLGIAQREDSRIGTTDNPDATDVTRPSKCCFSWTGMMDGNASNQVDKAVQNALMTSDARVACGSARELAAQMSSLRVSNLLGNSTRLWPF